LSIDGEERWGGISGRRGVPQVSGKGGAVAHLIGADRSGGLGEGGIALPDDGILCDHVQRDVSPDPEVAIGREPLQLIDPLEIDEEIG